MSIQTEERILIAGIACMIAAIMVLFVWVSQ